LKEKIDDLLADDNVSPEEKAELAKIEAAERVADFKQQYDSMSKEDLFHMLELAKGKHCPYLVKNDGNVEYFSGLNAIILTGHGQPCPEFYEVIGKGGLIGEGGFEILDNDESDVKMVRLGDETIQTNPREDFKFEKMLDEVSTQVKNAYYDDKIEFYKIVEEAELNALTILYEADAEKQKRIDAIKNVDLSAKPKTNAEKFRQFCKKSLQTHGEKEKYYGVTDGVKLFLLTTPNVKLEQMTKLIDYVAPDAVYNLQGNKFSDIVKDAVREDKVFRDRLKIARAKSNGFSR